MDSPSRTATEMEMNISRRRRAGAFWRRVFLFATIIAIIALGLLIITIIDDAYGYVAYEYEIGPESLAVGGVPLEELPKEELVRIFQENVSAGLYRRYNRDQPFEERSRENVLGLIQERVINPQVVASYSLFESILSGDDIRQEVKERYPDAELTFRSWLSWDFIVSPQSSVATASGVRTAILGSLWIIGITVLFAFPLGVGASIYLEEYASDNWINRIIQTNINNLAGVPSIIYGMLGLAIFVRALVLFTSGATFGAVSPTSANGRTIMSAGLTLGLLILPVIIINGQEAIRAVPRALREAGYGLGATKWQTIWSHVLPNALPGILTGTILAISRAVGETAPLVVVGAATYITSDPDGPFSRFTALPIQIYQWTTRPQEEFSHLASAAIIVLLMLLLSTNALAIILRNRLSRRML